MPPRTRRAATTNDGNEQPPAKYRAEGEDLSIEETNRLRISLGLKPLNIDTEKPAAAPTKTDTQKQEEEAAKTEELAERIKQQRERRIQQEKLAATKTLGEEGEDVDDLSAWVNKSRQQQTAQPAQKKKTTKKAAAKKNQPNDSDNEEGQAGAADLAGVKIAHSLDDIDAGEQVILTLEDKGILDDKGNLIEEDDLTLENVLVREDKKRAKAYADSQKSAKPLWEEDGKRRSLLDKYDEDEEEVLTLGDGGRLNLNLLTQQRKEDVGARLAAGMDAAAAAFNDNHPAMLATGNDYYTAEEIEAMKKPKKKKDRRLKKKAALTTEELAALEEQAAANDTGADMGSRADREARQTAKAADQAAAEAEKRARFDHALSKANYASLALREDASNKFDLGDEEEDDDLYKSLQKARQLAQATGTTTTATTTAGEAGNGAGGGLSKPEDIAQQLIQRREQQQQNGNGALRGGTVLNEIVTFTRAIQLKPEPTAGGEGGIGFDALPTTHVQPSDGGGGGLINHEDYNFNAQQEQRRQESPQTLEGEMEKVEDEKEMKVDAKPEVAEGSGWQPMEVDGVNKDAANNTTVPRHKKPLRKQQPDETDNRPIEPVIGTQKTVGQGLGAALAFLKERGELQQQERWAGRTNDSRNAYFTKAMGGYKDVYTQGRQEDKLAQDVEIALTHKDEYGRILTPKEAFRQMCHRFHGIYPSKNTKEKRTKQMQKELSQLKQATGEAESKSLEAVKAVQKKMATPYVVLSGNVKPGQSRDAPSGFDDPDVGLGGWEAIDGSGGRDSSVPKLGGGSGAPLTGKAKVEAMLGMKRPADGQGSMPPPPSKAPRHG